MSHSGSSSSLASYNSNRGANLAMGSTPTHFRMAANNILNRNTNNSSAASQGMFLSVNGGPDSNRSHHSSQQVKKR